MRENEVAVLRSTTERVARTLCLSVRKVIPLRLPPTESIFKRAISFDIWDTYGTHLHKTGHFVIENYYSVRKRHIVAKKKCRRV